MRRFDLRCEQSMEWAPTMTVWYLLANADEIYVVIASVA